MHASQLISAMRTGPGRVRHNNEDACASSPADGIFVVCDGMGGHAAGEVASALAVRTVHDEIKKQADLVQDYAAAAKGAAKVTKSTVLNPAGRPCSPRFAPIAPPQISVRINLQAMSVAVSVGSMFLLRGEKGAT